MNSHLHRPISSGNGSLQNIFQGSSEADDSVTAEVMPCSIQLPTLGLEDQTLQVLESSDDCIKVLDLDGRILFMNRGGQLLLDIQEVTLFLNTPWVNFWQGTAQQAAKEAIAKARAGQVSTFQGYCPTFSGKPKWWDIKITPMRGSEGQIERLLCISRDITERKLAEDERRRTAAALREAKTRFRQVFDNNMVAMGTWTSAGGITEANDALLNLIGYTRTDLEAGLIRWSELTPPEYHERDLQAVAEVRAKGVCTPYEKAFIHKDGHRQPILIGSGRFDEETGTGIFCAFDISNLKQTEAALSESEAKYRLLFNAMDEGYFLCDVVFDEDDSPIDIFYVDANPAATHIVGSEYTGRRLKDIDPRYESYWYEIFGRVARTGQGERLQQYAEPGQKWYDFYVFKVGDANSRRVAVVFQDISDRKQAEAILQEGAARQSFLLELSDALRGLSNAEDIRYQAACILGKHLGASRVGYAEAEDDEIIVVTRNYTNGVPGIEGRYHYDDYGPELLREFKAGRTVVRSDIANDPSLTDAEKAAHATLQLGATVNVPLLKAGRLVAVLFAHFQEAHAWSDSELALITEVAERIWDAVERARAEAALCASEAKYRSLFESMDEGFCLIEVLFDDTGKAFDYRFLEPNPAFEKQTGLVNVVGKTVREVAPQHEAYWFEIYGRVALTGVPERFENFAEVAGRFYDVYAFRVGEPQEHKVAVLFNDISDRKQAEAAITADLRDTQLLRDLSARLATEDNIQALYQEIMATAIALTQADAGTVQILDETTQELVLLSTQGINQKMVEHFYRVNATSNTPCGIALRNSIRSFVDFDVPASKDPDGSMQLHIEGGLLSAQSTPLISRSGRPIGMVSTHWRTRHRPSERELRFLDLLARQAADLIEQRQAEAQRKQLLEREQAAREAAEGANRIKDEFLAVLSHELRSPLNPILGWSKLLQTGKLDPSKTIQALATIERNAKLQSELIEDLLDVSRILQGKLSLNVAPVNLAVAIGGAMETVRLAAEAKSIQVKATLAEDLGLISGDSTRVQQVIWNLLSNAVKFTPPGGQVNIRLEQVDSSAQVIVCDTGQGISPDFLPYVFDYFRQADGATTRKFGGLGLGLAISRHLVELHGGTITVASPGQGQGTTFTVRLPLMPTSPQTNQEMRSPQPSLNLNGIKVLVVDDETDTRELVVFVLEQQGAKVTAVASAHEALLVLPQTKPDILLSDIGMPEINGYMLIQQVRTLAPEQGGQIPAIALTAYAGEMNQQQALAVGFQKHIAKPIEPEELVSAIVCFCQQN